MMFLKIIIAKPFLDTGVRRYDELKTIISRRGAGTLRTANQELKNELPTSNVER
ncbi:MAG: hypothetical protein ABIL58_01960 [Pseudomonadota bacterium]